MRHRGLGLHMQSDEVSDCSLGKEVLTGVLHVPDLAVSQFSVRAVLASGMAVSFSPPETPGACSTVMIARGSRVILTASKNNGLYFINGQCTAGAAALVDLDELSSTVTGDRRLVHLGFSPLGDIASSNLIHGCPVTRGAFLQAQKQQLCEPCIATKLRRTSHPRRAP